MNSWKVQKIIQFVPKSTFYDRIKALKIQLKRSATGSYEMEDNDLATHFPDVHRSLLQEEAQKVPLMIGDGVGGSSALPSDTKKERRPRRAIDRLSEAERKEVIDWDRWLTEISTLSVKERETKAKEKGYSYRTIQRLKADWDLRQIDAILIFLYRAKRSDAGKRRHPVSKLVAMDALAELLLCKFEPEEVRRRLRPVCKHLNVKVPCLSTLCNWLANIDPARCDYFRLNEKAWDDAYGYYIARAKPILPNQIWTLDSHRLDIFVWNPDKRNSDGSRGGWERPWIVAIKDECTNRIVGYRLTFQPNADEIALTLSEAIVREGRPEAVLLDNGLDYNASFVLLACRSLGIHIINALPYNAKGKPIERFFRTLKEQCISHLPGFCGSHPKEKEKLPDIEPQLTLDQLHQEISLWLIDFHRQPSRALGGKSPDRSLQEARKRGWLPVMVDQQRVSFAFMVTEERVISRIGIEFEGATYWNEAFEGRTGVRVQVKAAITDYSKLFVDLDGDWLAAERKDKAAFIVQGDRSHIRLGRQIRAKGRKKVEDALDSLVVASTPVREIADQLALEERKNKESELASQVGHKVESNVHLFTPGLSKMKSDVQKSRKSRQIAPSALAELRNKCIERGVPPPVDFLDPSKTLNSQCPQHLIALYPKAFLDQMKSKGKYIASNLDLVASLAKMTAESLQQREDHRKRIQLK